MECLCPWRTKGFAREDTRTNQELVAAAVNMVAPRQERETVRRSRGLQAHPWLSLSIQMDVVGLDASQSRCTRDCTCIHGRTCAT